MKCPKCQSSRIAVDKKTGEVMCETCGYTFDDQEATEYKKDIMPGQQGKKPEKKVW
jgi:transcription initiation factor TFIIIB Brf1 subunit/transcription initiation factor TFIIB